MKYEEADASCELMREMFPELTHSLNIIYVPPSKKALRRFPCPEVTPRQDTVSVHYRLLDLIHHAVVEVANLGLRELPARTMALDRGLALRSERQPSSMFQEWSRRRFQNICTQSGYATDSEARVSFMRQELPMSPFPASSFVNKKNAHSHGLANGSATKFYNPISELLAIPSSSFVSMQESSNLSLVPTTNGSDRKPFLDSVPEVLLVPTPSLSPSRNSASRSFPRRISERFTSTFARIDHKRQPFIE
jgi:hypothetical protein